MSFRQSYRRVRPVILQLLAAWMLVVGVDSTDVQSQETAQFRVYALQHVPAADAKRMLQELLSDLAGDVQIVADPQSKQLLLRGPAEAQQVAEQLLKQVDRPAALPKPPAARVLKVHLSPVSTVESLAALRASISAQEATITLPPEGNQLVVYATSPTHERVTQILNSLNRPRINVAPQSPAAVKPIPETVDVGRFRQVEQSEASPRPFVREASTAPIVTEVVLRVRTVDSVKKALQQLLGTRLHETSRDAYTYITRDGRRTRLEFDTRGHSCRLTGPSTLVQQFSTLLAHMDRPADETGQRTRFLPVRNVEPTRLKQAFDAYRTGTRPISKQPTPGGEPQSRLEPDSAIQLVNFQQPTGTAQPGNETPNKSPSDAEADDPTQLLRRDADVDIQTLPDLDAIIIRGRDVDVKELTRIIREIERISAEATPEIEVYHLKHVRGEALDALVQKVLEDLTATIQGRISITPLVKPNALLLIGWGEAITKAKELIAKLDTPVRPDTQMQVFRLRSASANQIQTTVQSFFQSRQGLGPTATVTVDARTNALIVNASPRDMQEVALLIKQLDTNKSDAVNQVRIVRLKNSLATDLASTLQSTLETASGRGPARTAGRSAMLELLMSDPNGSKVVNSGLLDNVRITPDARTNTLIVSGPAESLPVIESLIEHLDEAPSGNAQIKVFQIVNANAGELVVLLRSLFPEQTGASSVPQLASAEGETSLVGVRFSIDARTNAIVATGAAGDLRIIEALLLRLDQKDAPHRVNTVYELKNSPALDVAAAINEFLRSERLVQRAAPGEDSPTVQIEREVVVVPEPVRNTLIVSATQRYYEEIINLIEELDSPPPEVMIQVIIAEIDLDHTREFGVELGIQDSLLFDRSLLSDLITTTNSAQQSTAAGVFTSTQEIVRSATLAPGFHFNNEPFGNSGSDTALQGAGSVGGQALSNFAVGRVNSELSYGGLVLSAGSDSVNVLVRALSDSKHMEILSRPQIRTLDNQPAYIQVGERVPRITGSTINEVGQVNTITLENVGLILAVVPRISPDGMVVMEVDAEKSELGSDQDGIPVSVSIAGIVRSPRVKLTMAQTTVSAASGETVVIGGLITHNDVSINRKVPWLSDIPVLGNLFRFDSYSQKRKELLIILTPHVIKDSRDSDRIKKIELSRMSWCSSDIFQYISPEGIDGIEYQQIDDDRVPVIYPDTNPGYKGEPDTKSLPSVPPPVPDPDLSRRENPENEPLRLNDQQRLRAIDDDAQREDNPFDRANTPQVRPASYEITNTELPQPRESPGRTSLDSKDANTKKKRGLLWWKR